MTSQSYGNMKTHSYARSINMGSPVLNPRGYLFRTKAMRPSTASCTSAAWAWGEPRPGRSAGSNEPARVGSPLARGSWTSGDAGKSANRRALPPRDPVEPRPTPRRNRPGPRPCLNVLLASGPKAYLGRKGVRQSRPSPSDRGGGAIHALLAVEPARRDAPAAAQARSRRCAPAAGRRRARARRAACRSGAPFARTTHPRRAPRVPGNDPARPIGRAGYPRPAHLDLVAGFPARSAGRRVPGGGGRPRLETRAPRRAGLRRTGSHTTGPPCRAAGVPVVSRCRGIGVSAWRERSAVPTFSLKERCRAAAAGTLAPASFW